MLIFSSVVVLLLMYQVGYTLFSVRPRQMQLGLSKWKAMLGVEGIACLGGMSLYSPFIYGSLIHYAATTFFFLGLSLFGMAMFHMRVQVDLLPRPNAYSTWKVLAVLSILVCGFALMLFSLPVTSS